MKLGIKDILVIGLVSLISFPVLYLAMLYVNGQMRIEFVNPSQKKESGKEHKLLDYSKKMDSLQVVNTEAFLAKMKESESVMREKEALARQQERINMLVAELETTRQQLAKERSMFEVLVKNSDDLDAKKVKQLSKVYEAMRATEAASILETLEDDLFIKIINNISDDRQKAKIMAAISNEKAARISKKMGKSSLAP